MRAEPSGRDDPGFDLAAADGGGFDQASDDPFEDQSEDPFDRAVHDAIAGLPEAYRAHLATVALVIADEPTPEELAELHVPGLYGLYRGIPRTTLAADSIAAPSVITLYRGPLERGYPTPDRLRAGVGDTLLHELAHHLGISDARLHELRALGR